MAVVRVADYRRRSGDIATPYTLAERLLEDATGLVEAALGRWLEEAAYGETLLVHPINGSSGRVWPRAYPITSVTVPTEATIEGDEAQIIRLTADLWSTAPAWETVLYVGGYTIDDLPVPVRHVIVEVAHAIRTPANSMTFLYGAASVSLGDASVRFRDLDADTAMGSLDALVPGAAGLLADHRHPRAHAWGFA